MPKPGILARHMVRAASTLASLGQTLRRPTAGNRDFHRKGRRKYGFGKDCRFGKAD